MSLDKMIYTSSNFQTSVNIKYDFNNSAKIKNFIPTSQGAKFIKDILQSVQNTTASKARILIGAYGKGKSYIVLETLSILFNEKERQQDLLFILEKIKKIDVELYEIAKDYVTSEKRLLPIVINGNSSSLSQSFLFALHSTLKRNEFKDLMPDTHFEAAVKMLEKWENEFPETIAAFNKKASKKNIAFKESLRNYDTESFEEFEKLYPTLTSGSEFNPFAGFNVVELYEKVCAKLANFGFNGLYIVYDEFGKYLESSITKASVQDIKLLQDFAELCDRSGKTQMHILLICHKEIENYIDQLPKQKVDGWKGVSERFRHIHLHNHYSEVYTLIEAAIQKNEAQWKSFVTQHLNQFIELSNTWKSKSVFKNVDANDFERLIVQGSYPLHPVTTFILPRLSEKVAQNERTLFTFLSGSDKNTLPYILENSNLSKESDYIQNDKIKLFTPDVLYDYFEKQMKTEPYGSLIKNQQILATTLLNSVENNSLESKIIKTVSLIYCLNQFERLSPEVNIIFEIYQDAGFESNVISRAFSNLTNNLGLLYTNTHNNYIQLKNSSGVDINKNISDIIEKRRNQVTELEILNSTNTEKYVYPIAYNAQNKMTRYFVFKFISVSDLELIQNGRFPMTTADGNIFALNTDEEISESLLQQIKDISTKLYDSVFIIPKQKFPSKEILRKFDAVSFIKESLDTTSALYDEYDLIHSDLNEVLKELIHSYIQPEKANSHYIFDGKEEILYRKADLTNILSKKCTKNFTKTPVVNNEMINKDNLTGAARKASEKLLNAIISAKTADLGLSGSGQEVSFRNSTLCVTGILNLTTVKKVFSLAPQTIDKERDANFANLFETINIFIEKAKTQAQNFTTLISSLTKSKNHIGLRKGLIPIYLGVALVDYKKNILIKNAIGEVALNAKTLLEIVGEPENYTITVEAWNNEKESYIEELEKLFKDFIREEEKITDGFNYLRQAIFRWYRSLPQYSKQVKNENNSFIKIFADSTIGSQEILFSKIPKSLGITSFSNSLFDKIATIKAYYDNVINTLAVSLVAKTKKILENSNNIDQKSLFTVAISFTEKLTPNIENHVFENNAQKIVSILKNASNDETLLLEKLARELTGLSINDWNDTTEDLYFSKLQIVLETLKSYKPTVASEKTYKISCTEQAIKDCNITEQNLSDGITLTSSNENSTYLFGSFDESGNSNHKTITKVKCSEKAKVLQQELLNTIDEMGQSITEAEKRQVLINLLEKFL